MIITIIKKIRLSSSSGFTLVEMLASIFIFSILVAIFSNVYMASLNLQRKAYNFQQVVENTNFIFESMLKETRMANLTTPNTDDNCNGPDGTPLDQIDFIHPVNGNIAYTLVGTDLHRIIGGVTDTILNSDSVEFTRLMFCVKGNSSGDGLQPKVTVVASIRSKKTSQQEILNIQTTVSQRYLSN